MPKVSVPGFIHAKPADEWDAGAVRGMSLTFFQCDDMTVCGYVLVCPHTMVVDVPDSWDPRAEQIAILKKKEKEIREKFNADVLKIQRAISELQAIEYAPEAA